MYITTRDGKRIRLNEEDVKAAEDKYGGINFVGKPVAVCNEGDRMRKIWIVTVEHDKKAHNYRSYKGEMDLEFVAEMKFDHEPTQEELLYVISAHGVGLYETIVRIDTAYEWTTKYND